MDISVNKMQKEIAREARRFLAKECSSDFVRDMIDDPLGVTDALWEKMVELDWMKMCIPAEFDGLGMELIDLYVVLQEMGRAILPGPFFSTVLLGANTIIEAGTSSQKAAYLPKIGNGDMKGTLALYEKEAGADIGYIQMPAKENADGFILEGIKEAVPDAAVADFIICAARTAAADEPFKGVTLFIVDPHATGVVVTPMPAMDGTRKIYSVSLEGVHVGKEAVLGEVHNGWVPLTRVMQKAQVGVCGECVGAAERAMEMAVVHAKSRIQFDQPIGVFQAIKHSCAQMYVDVESSRSVAYWAAWAQDHGDAAEAALSACSAKAYCSEAFTRVASAAIQVLGGMGMTWENDLHLYLKRAKANELSLGDPTFHRERIVSLLSENPALAVST